MSTEKIFALSKGWKIDVDSKNIGLKEEWFKLGPTHKARDARVPGIIQEIFPGYHGVAWYWLKFTPQVMPGAWEKCILHFGVVDYKADVWLNGQFLGSHEGGETSFGLDATSALKADTGNLLAVRVLNPTYEPIDGIVLGEAPGCCHKVIPNRVGASFNHGGIELPVEMRIIPIVRISDVFVKPDLKSGLVQVEVNLDNDTEHVVSCLLTGTIASASTEGSSRESVFRNSLDIKPGQTIIGAELLVPSPSLWSPEDPYLYRVNVHIDVIINKTATIKHEYSIRYGFREFNIGDDGYFRLNGRRIFVRSAHTGNSFPIGQHVAHNPDMLRRDLLYAKAAGFNMIRFIAGVAYPEQLDFCDEIGLMVYEESYTSWFLKDSPQMAERYDRSVSEMLLRDRNHASIVIWGLLNETGDGPVFRHAKGVLPLIRSLDDSRLVLLGSGRFDSQQDIGSVSNPKTSQWQHLWGTEAPDAPSSCETSIVGYIDGAGDAHAYPLVPHDSKTINFFRTLGSNTKPVFLSEYGIGSIVNAIRVTRLFEQEGARLDLEDASLYRTMAEKFVADWHKFGMDDVYPFPEDMLQESQRLHARQRIIGFDAIRSNPNICGYNLTSMVDGGMAGEGLWTTWRELKPAIMETLQDGWAPLRWCLFVEPLHGYSGRSFKIEAVLANENVLKPGDYPVRFRIFGPAGIIWERSICLTIPEPAEGKDLPLALPVIYEEITIEGSSGVYYFAATMERGGAPAGGRLKFYISDPAMFPSVETKMTLLGIEKQVESWLSSRGINCRYFEKKASPLTEIILVGDLSKRRFELDDWQELARRIATGSVVIFLTPSAFKRGEDDVGWLPLMKKGNYRKIKGEGTFRGVLPIYNDLYHSEYVAKEHPIFDGLPPRGILDWDYYGQIISDRFFDGEIAGDDVAAACFAVGYLCPDGYVGGSLVSSHKLGSGRFILNSLRIMENIGKNPAADRILLNMINYACKFRKDLPVELPEDFVSLLNSIGYTAEQKS